LILRGYSLTREPRPALNIDSLVNSATNHGTVDADSDFTHVMSGQFSIGYDKETGMWKRQGSVSKGDQTQDQGYGAVQLNIQDLNGRSHTVSGVINQSTQYNKLKEGHTNEKDFYINFQYTNDKFGTLNARTYQDNSLMESLRILDSFNQDPSNSDNLLYEFTYKLNSILGILTGRSSLRTELSKNTVTKEDILENLEKMPGLLRFDDLNLFDKNTNEIIDGRTSYDLDPNIVQLLDDEQNHCRIRLNLKNYDIGIEEPFVLDLNFSDSAQSDQGILGIRVENLKSTSLGKYGTFYLHLRDGAYFVNNLQTFSGESTEGDGSNAFFDLKDLPLLVNMGIYTTDVKSYYLTGTLEIPEITFSQTALSTISNRFMNAGTINTSLHLNRKTINLTVALDVLDSQENTGIRQVNALFRSKNSYPGQIIIPLTEWEEYEEGRIIKTQHARRNVEVRKNGVYQTDIVINKGDVYLKYKGSYTSQTGKQTKDKSILGKWTENSPTNLTSQKTVTRYEYLNMDKDSFINDMMYMIFKYLIFEEDAYYQLTEIINVFKNANPTTSIDIKIFDFFKYFGKGNTTGEKTNASTNKSASGFTALLQYTFKFVVEILNMDGYFNINHRSPADYTMSSFNFYFYFKLSSLLSGLGSLVLGDITGEFAISISATNNIINASNIGTFNGLITTSNNIRSGIVNYWNQHHLGKTKSHEDTSNIVVSTTSDLIPY